MASFGSASVKDSQSKTTRLDGGRINCFFCTSRRTLGGAVSGTLEINNSAAHFRFGCGFFLGCGFGFGGAVILSYATFNACMASFATRCWHLSGCSRSASLR